MKSSKTDTNAKSILALVAIFVLLALVSWRLVGSARNNDKINKQAQAAGRALVRVGADDTIPDPSDFVKPYILPVGWSELACQKGTNSLIIPDSPINSCESSSTGPADSGYIGVIVRNLNFINPESCAQTLIRRENSNDEFPANEYKCDDVIIGGKHGIRQQGIHLKENTSVIALPRISVTYEFPTNTGRFFEINYTHYTGSKLQDRTTEFDDFVRTLKFVVDQTTPLP